MDKQKLEALIQLSIKYRGEILHDSIQIEKEVDTFLANYFINDVEKQIELLELILDRLTFDAKLAIFDTMLKKLHPGIYEKKFSKLISELRILKDQRNMFAHYMTYSFYDELDEIPKEFQLINFRNSTDFKKFSKGDYLLFKQRVVKCREVIREALHM
ncbi:hypothetical protein [Mucilaginibacter flavidus]|uniref:hypothetical protein n=1 Tax=Mucilaginibacter flavidus TaxID=2949309 RepID=UPI00209245EF|nr:hypothetical protein [Mucilaginibacter flavidus]MCO5945343.1 hypothetical protein [Mucilaginibacter flavidus]